jgi:hypothetical protein
MRVAAVALVATCVGACSSGSGGHQAASAHSPSAPTTSAVPSQTKSKTGSTATSQVARGETKTGPSAARAKVASPVVQCGNHLRMGLIMTNSTQPVAAQVVTFSRAVHPAPSWEVMAFQNVVTEFSSVVAGHGKQEALQRPAFAYPALLRVCTQSAAH